MTQEDLAVCCHRCWASWGIQATRKTQGDAAADWRRCSAWQVTPARRMTLGDCGFGCGWCLAMWVSRASRRTPGGLWGDFCGCSVTEETWVYQTILEGVKAHSHQ